MRYFAQRDQEMFETWWDQTADNTSHAQMMYIIDDNRKRLTAEFGEVPSWAGYDGID